MKPKSDKTRTVLFFDYAMKNLLRILYGVSRNITAYLKRGNKYEEKRRYEKAVDIKLGRESAIEQISPVSLLKQLKKF
ncbi:MAG: hypothetical protein LBT50_03465 [Prevotellaceae bacterium]|jgi:hypothetical protein|nr:hypothetical protein [Prevotellaceae bacterium]